MFLSPGVIANAVKMLNDVHPFYGTTYLACKAENLPEGRSVPFAISEIETNFLKRYYQTDKESSFFYTAFITPVRKKRWINLKKYASSSLQSTRTRSAFKHAFIHETGSKNWGWHPLYRAVLQDNLKENRGQFEGKPIPTFELAAWLFRDLDFGAEAQPRDLINRFKKEFNVGKDEDLLFDFASPSPTEAGTIFRDEKISRAELRKLIGDPLDAKPESSGLLASLSIRGVGPAESVELNAAPRLNLLTGDNGLGKTFVLETIWWALTGHWTDDNSIAQPDIQTPRSEPRISFEIATESARSVDSSFRYEWRTGQWAGKRRADALAGLTVYARVDGSYAVWDPTGTLVRGSDTNVREMLEELPKRERARAMSRLQGMEQVVLNNQEVFDGGRQTEGLLRDWVKWQNRPDRYPFAELCQVLELLSPPDMKSLKPGNIQSSIFSHLEVPTISYPYGDVPIVHASAGIRRIISLAYLVVWAWTEHKKISERMREEPQRRMVILIDELEAHLHPLWQRSILPALIRLGDALYSELKIQFFIATHSPLVMASAEPFFDENTDKQFHVKMSVEGKVTFEEKDFVEHGLVDYWLVSPTFNLRYPTNAPAEKLIDEAKRLQLEKDPSINEIRRVSDGLSSVLPSTDPFWVRWLFFAERHGVEI